MERAVGVKAGQKKRENKNAGAAQSVTPTELFLMVQRRNEVSQKVLCQAFFQESGASQEAFCLLFLEKVGDFFQES